MSPRTEEVEVMDDAENGGGEEEQPTARRRNKNNNKKPRLFADSGLTDAERREIRQDQRALQQTLRDGDCATIDDLAVAREKNNRIFADKVRFTREAVLDADNVDLIAVQYAQQVEKQVQVPRYDALKLVQKLIHKCSSKTSSSQYFDWALLGAEAGICFNALPERVSFLAGALDHEVVTRKAARKPREKTVADDSEEVKPEEVENANNKGDADKLSAMEKAMRVIRKKILVRTREETEKNPAAAAGEHPDIDGVQFLFNPTSFTQTVENIFNFSFLIKKGEAEIGVRPALNRRNGTPSPGLFVALRTIDPDDTNVACTQAVCSFTMADWRRLCEGRQNFEAGDLPHRTGTKHGRADAATSSL